MGDVVTVVEAVRHGVQQAGRAVYTDDLEPGDHWIIGDYYNRQFPDQTFCYSLIHMSGNRSIWLTLSDIDRYFRPLGVK